MGNASGPADNGDNTNDASSIGREGGHSARPAGLLRTGSRGSGDKHRRSISGSILSRLPFLKTEDGQRLPATSSGLEGADVDRDENERGGNAIAHAYRQTKMRKRKGSLRKTAILGTGKIDTNGSAGRERKGTMKSTSTYEGLAHGSQNFNGEEDASHYQNTAANNALVGASADVASGHSSAHHTTLPTPASPPTSSTWPVATSSINTDSTLYNSTTDDDVDSVTYPRASASLPGQVASQPYYTTSATTASLLRRRSTNKSHPSHSSPLSRPPVTSEDDWDYTETEWWGWIILIVTWIVFVVGMGSCLGVWSWAWDVGETPYAPPELEDDPTLPIVGYYPALMILTAVMAWVWVVVAWVGMKYFRHAKVMGDDG